MTFATFIIVCIVGLLGYYGYLIFFAPDKTASTFDDKVTGYSETEITIAPPIKVSLDMVTFHPTVSGASSDKSEEKQGVKNEPNMYNSPNPLSMGTSPDEVFIAFHQEDIFNGNKLFSQISI